MDFQAVSAEDTIPTEAAGAPRVTARRIPARNAVTASKTDLLCLLSLLTMFEEKDLAGGMADSSLF